MIRLPQEIIAYKNNRIFTYLIRFASFSTVPVYAMPTALLILFTNVATLLGVNYRYNYQLPDFKRITKVRT